MIEVYSAYLCLVSEVEATKSNQFQELAAILLLAQASWVLNLVMLLNNILRCQFAKYSGFKAST